MPQTKLFFAPALTPKSNEADRTIGAILVESGRLAAAEVEKIVQLQREQSIRFGAAATSLGLLSEVDVQYALSRQFDHPYLVPGESNVNENVVAAYGPFNPQIESLRSLRSQIMQRWFNASDRKTLAILSAGRKEGRSFMAANLAVVFSQLGLRTLLIDGDMRSSCQHELFAIDNRIGLSAILAGRGATELVRRVQGLMYLHVLPAGAEPPNPLELLARPRFPELLRELSQEYEAILVDTPAAEFYGDAHSIAVSAGGALLVVRNNKSRVSHVRRLAETAAHGGATILGTVLNDF